MKIINAKFIEESDGLMKMILKKENIRIGKLKLFN